MASRYDQTFQADPSIPRPVPGVIELGVTLPVGSQILDCGSGEGRHAITLARAGHTVEAWDISSVGLSITSRIAADEDLQITTKECDARSAIKQVPQGAFQAVLMVFVLHHFTEAQTLSFISSTQSATAQWGYHYIVHYLGGGEIESLDNRWHPESPDEILALYPDTEWSVLHREEFPPTIQGLPGFAALLQKL